MPWELQPCREMKGDLSGLVNDEDIVRRTDAREPLMEIVCFIVGRRDEHDAVPADVAPLPAVVHSG